SGVLGDVGGDGLFGDARAVAERLDRPDVELGAPTEGTGRLVLSGRDRDRGVGVRGGGADRVGEEVDGCPGRWCGAGSVRSVEPDHGMKVQSTAFLELGDLAVRDAKAIGELPAGKASAGGDFAAQACGEALPELSGVVVEQHGARVVVRRRVESGAELRGVRGVAGAAAAGAVVGAVVDRAEGRGGEGGEHARVIPDGGGNVAAVVTSEARADEVIGVARVGPGAGRATG